MRTKQTVHVLRRTAALVAGLTVAGLFPATAADAVPETQTSSSDALAVPKSVFIEDARGKDPFFPKSTRRQLKPVTAEETAPVGPASLVLLGITGPPERRIALINNQTFAAGEENTVRIPGGDAKVKCVEIRERSVVVTIQGGDEKFELRLPERTLPIAPESGISE